ncbi:MAG: Ku protein [Austwickia sp.]|nr:Ku protein [Austwickia sp.]MBK8437918.1 Ku protein [Austwickia sp.]MBK9100219.1 Ku protein [Austwickia sp.]
MRAMWKGAVSFGLVTIPVRLYTATESHDIQFHQVRASDGSRIKYKRVAEADGQEVAYAEIAKGYTAPDGRTVILSDEDLASLPSKSSKEISVEKFVPAPQIDPILLDKTYYLEPDKAAVKPYALLREALRSSDRMAVVTIAVRSRMTMAVLRVRDEVIVLQTLLWPDEIRTADFDVLDGVLEPSAAEVAMADLLINSMAADFEPNDYADDYQEAVEALVERKLAGGESTVAPQVDTADAGQVVDLLAALQKSVDRAKAARAQAGGGDATSAEAASADSNSDADSVGAAAEEPATKPKTARKRSAAKKAG